MIIPKFKDYGFVSTFATEQVDDLLFMMIKPLVYIDPILHIKVTVPVDFVSDGPSVPRVPILYYIAGGKGKRGGVVHDYLYRNKYMARKFADLVYYHTLLDHSNISNKLAWLMYKAVDICGNKHRKSSRPYCLDTYTSCTNKVCSHFTGIPCPMYDTNYINNIELLPGCKYTKAELFELS